MPSKQTPTTYVSTQIAAGQSVTTANEKALASIAAYANLFTAFTIESDADFKSAVLSAIAADGDTVEGAISDGATEDELGISESGARAARWLGLAHRADDWDIVLAAGWNATEIRIAAFRASKQKSEAFRKAHKVLAEEGAVAAVKKLLEAPAGAKKESRSNGEATLDKVLKSKAPALDKITDALEITDRATVQTVYYDVLADLSRREIIVKMLEDALR